jgi:hypothetical protein
MRGLQSVTKTYKRHCFFTELFPVFYGFFSLITVGASANTSNGILADVSVFSAVGVRDIVPVFSLAVVYPAVVDVHAANLRSWSH